MWLVRNAHRMGARGRWRHTLADEGGGVKVGGLFGSSPCDVRQGLVRNEFLKEALCRRNKNAVDH